MVDGPWSDAENDAIVADHFDMLADDLMGRPYNKSAHNRALQTLLGRSKGSIEFKHANVSAALRGFGQPILGGYLPRFNFQMSLAQAVERWLTANPEWAERLARPKIDGLSFDQDRLYLDTPPSLRNTAPPDQTVQMQAIARHFNIAEREERNRALGKAGEKRALAHEKAVLRDAGRDDLARRIVWVSHEQGDGAGYDIASFTPEGAQRLIEVKTTNGWDLTPFHISSNELAVAQEKRDNWYLFRLYDFARTPRAFELRPPLDAHVELTATAFRASFQGSC